jgi:radical SAM family uncharacterized protein
MLDMAGLSPLAAARDGYPLVIAGGPCAFNPEPLTDFIDLFVIGEGEEVLIELLCLIAEAKKEGWDKKELLRRAMKVGGMYVPFQRSECPGDLQSPGRAAAPTMPLLAPFACEGGRPEGPGGSDRGDFAASTCQRGEDADFQEASGGIHAPRVVAKSIIKDMGTAPFPAKGLIPCTQVVHDRIMLEIMRGCSRGCRFCQAGIIYRPVREKSLGILQDQAQEQVKSTGYDEMGLISLSSADYSCIGELVDSLLDEHGKNGVSISLPSLRVDAFSVELAAQVQRVRKSGLTLAPEAGSQRLRDIINKGITDDDIFSAAAAAFKSGYTSIKLYFMIGLPHETTEDIEDIGEICRKILEIGRREKPKEVRKPIKISLGVATFVPKAHTPFQWYGQAKAAEIKTKQSLLLDIIKPMKAVNISFHDLPASRLEAAFARGGRQLGPVLLSAWRLGCVFDGWSEYFRADLWEAAFAEHGFTIDMFAEQKFAKEDMLPWDHISSGVTKSWLWREKERAEKGGLTADCRLGDCSGCGVCSIIPGGLIEQ